MDFGAWELRSWNEIPRDQLDAWAAAPLTYAPPGGESVGVLRERVTAFLVEHVGADDEDLAVVTHAGVMKILAAQLQGLDQETWFKLRFGYGELSLLDVPASHARLRPGGPPGA